MLECVQEPETGKDVERNVKQIEDSTGHAYVSPGELSGRNMRLCSNHYVRLVIAPDSVDEMNPQMDAVRIRISPWQLVYKRTKEIFLDENLSNKVLKVLLVCASDQLKIRSMKSYACFSKRWKKERQSQRS